MSPLQKKFWPVLALLSLSLGSVRGALAQTPRAGEAAGRTLLATALADEARVRARSLSKELGPKEALALLQAAQRIDPENPDVLRLLVMAETATGDYDAAREVLRTLVRVDPGNLVAQVQFLDNLAHGRPVEEQIRLYSAAMQRASFDPQVRSEAAVRAGRLMLERGDQEEASKCFQQALALNDANMPAWQETAALLIRRSAPPRDQLAALVNLLYCNPYQPQTLMTGAQILGAHNAHSLAADWLVAMQEQLIKNRIQVPAEVYLDLANELVCANRINEAKTLLGALLGMEKPPIAVPMLAWLVQQSGQTIAVPSTTPAAEGEAPAPPVTKSAADMLAMMRERAAADLAANPNVAGALEQSLWTDLYCSGTVTPDTEKHLATLKEIAGEQSPVYQRLLGWQLLRQGKLAEAKTTLVAVSAKDSLAALGLVYLAEKQADKKGISAYLQLIWDSQPVGVPAAIVCAEARRLATPVVDPPETRALIDVAKKYPDSMLILHREPRDLILVQPRLSKVRYSLGESIPLNVAFLNSTDRPLYAGPGGAVPNDLALEAIIQGGQPIRLGVYGNDTLSRIYRLDRRATVVLSMRADQGILYDMLYSNPNRMFTMSISLLTNPQLAGKTVFAGLGGQKLNVGTFDRTGLLIGNTDVLMRMVSDLPGMPVDQQMLMGSVLNVVSYGLRGQETPATQPAATQGAAMTAGELRKQVSDAVLKQLQAGHPLVQAWLVRYAPPKDLPETVMAALNQLQTSPDPTVRMMSDLHTLTIAGRDPDALAKALEALRARGAQETDPVAKRWNEVLITEALSVPPPEADTGDAAPATAPASQPATP